jgi:hypothetical protein
VIWGRQVEHLHLVTAGGPSWKPLPVLLTTLLARFGSAAPNLWLIVARAGGLLALALAFELAFRLTRARDRRGRDRMADRGRGHDRVRVLGH